MEGSSEDKYNKEVCDLKHRTLEERMKELEETVEEILKPGSGHLAVMKNELEHRMEKQDSKLNGLIMTIITTITGTAIAIGGEFIKQFVK